MAFLSRNVGDVVSEILMSRTAFSGSFLVVEGESDSKFFSGRISQPDCQIVIAGGKTTVCGAVQRAYELGNSGLLGAVDNDYDSLCGVALPSPHIVRTDARDLECLLMRSYALERVVSEIGSPTKIAAFEAEEQMSVREALVRRSLIFGKARLLDRKSGWKFDFDNLSPWRFADENSWAIDEAAIVAHMAKEVGMHDAQLSQSLAALHVADPFEILHGRDTATTLAIGLKRRLGNSQLSVEKLCQMLRLAFDDAMATACSLFHDIRNWEAQNTPYRVLVQVTP